MRSQFPTVCACLALVILFSGAAIAQSAPKLNVEHYELPNGLDVILCEDHTIPAVAVNIWYHVGSKNERNGRTGFAHLFEHMMFQGSEHYNFDVFNFVEQMGGECNGSTNVDRTNYFEVVPKNYLEQVLALDADRMGNLLPTMDQAKLDNQRDVVKNERRQRYENEPYAISWELVPHLLYPSDHGYSWPTIGSMEDLSAASLDDVKEFFVKFYSPNNASLCITGDFDPAQAKGWVEKYFGPIAPGRPIERVAEYVPSLDGVKRAVAEDRVRYPRLYMTWPTPGFYKPGDADLDILATILTYGSNSRLYKSLVHEKQIAQSIVAAQYSSEIGSRFEINAIVREGHTLEEVEGAIDAELQKVLSDGVTASEVAAAQNIYEMDFFLRLENIRDKADIINSYNVFLGDPNNLEWDLGRYRNVTPASVIDAAKKYLHLDKRLILSVVPQKNLAAKGEIDRAVKPTAGSDPKFVPPVPEMDKLENGLEIYVISRPDLPLVQVNLLVKSGWAAEPAEKPGLGSLTVGLLKNGTTSRTLMQISEEMKQFGAILTTSSSFDYSKVDLSVLKRNLDKALPVMADVVLNPLFAQDELDRQRSLRIERSKQENDHPVDAAFKTLYQLLYGDHHPYGQSYTGTGTVNFLEGMTRENVIAFYQSTFKPNNAALLFVGDITMSEAKEKAKRYFGSWQQGTSVSTVIPEPSLPDETIIYLIDMPGAVQSIVVAGHPGMSRLSPDYAAAQVINTALGDHFSSRLNMNLREDKGYTYGAYTFFTSRRGTGAFVAYSAVQTQSTKESVAEMVREFRDIVGSRPVSDVEMQTNREFLIRSLPQEFQSVAAIASHLDTLVQNGLPIDYWNKYMDQLASVDVPMVNAKAKEYLHPDNLIIVISGDRAKIEEGLRGLGIGEVVIVPKALH
ncbi:MAG: insulinase family protein [bacterium]|nr:insulinase family protein [bacterium]